MYRTQLAIAAALLSFTLAAAAPASSQKPEDAKSRAADTGFSRPKNVTIVGTSAIDTPTTITYANAHMVTDNGSTLDAVKLEAFIDQKTNNIDHAVATGAVKGTFTQQLTKRKYTVYADQGVYDPKFNQIHLTGSVRILVESTYTQGPLVQTGTTALVQLGSGPEYPKITTNDAKTTFTLNQ